MPVSQTDICNMALGHVGISTQIGDLTNEASVEARACRRFYGQCQNLLVESVPWNFLTEQIALQDLGSPSSPWTHRYGFPNTAARLNSIALPGVAYPQSLCEQIPFRIVRAAEGTGKAVLCNLPNAIAEVNAYPVDASEFSATFTQALALALAAHIGKPLQAPDALVKTAMQQWMAWYCEAVIQARNQEQPTPEPDSSFYTGRA